METKQIIEHLEECIKKSNESYQELINMDKSEWKQIYDTVVAWKDACSREYGQFTALSNFKSYLEYNK